MKNIIFSSIITFVILGFSSCEKTTAETVSISVNSIAEHDNFNSGDNLNVNVTYSDPTELHMYSVVVTNNTDSSEVLNLSGHNHSTEFTLDTTFVVYVTAHSDFELHATVSNHSGETAEKHVHFHVMP
jgi:hypothetical protein